MKIKVIAEKCTGCCLCENICSLSHLGFVDKNCSAVRITLDDLGESVHRPFLCKQCKVMKCLEDDLKEFPDLDIEAERKKFLWEGVKRVENCPFNGCFENKGKVYHCNLCDGDPQCVKVCSSGALTVVD
ncbi:MAG: 4Fe-4S dicluster domain-containing protein [bacterium]